MSQYIVSARKYRPDNFETLVGQDNIATTLKNSILRNQLAHAYLFCGPRGVGKTTTARIFAKMINCSNPSSQMEPCGECESCRSFAENRSYCIHELDAASNNGVDDIKALIDQVRVAPQVGKYSVYIIDEVHMLTQAAFNAFLKTLEEPPAHSIFILATTEKHKILPTILSRCQTYDFNRISVEDIVSNLRMIAEKEGISADDESLHVIATKADGAMRDALTIFDQTVAFCGTDIHYQDVIRNLNVLDYEYSFSLVENFLRGDYRSALLKFDEILGKGFNALAFVAALSSHFRDLMVTKAGGAESLLELPESLKRRYQEQAQFCSVKFIYDALNITTQCEAGYRASVNPRLHIEFALMKLCFLNAGEPAAPAEAKLSAAPAAKASAPEEKSAAPVAKASAPEEKSAAPVAKVSAPEEKSAAPVPENANPEAQTGNVSEGDTEAAQRRRRTARPAVSALGIDNIVKAAGTAPEVHSAAVSDEMPENSVIEEKWRKELVSAYASQPRLAHAIASAPVEIVEENDAKVLTFRVHNVAQRNWIQEKCLFEMEKIFVRILGSSKISLRVDVIPVEQTTKTVYTDDEKARYLRENDPQVDQLMKQLDLGV